MLSLRKIKKFVYNGPSRRRLTMDVPMNIKINGEMGSKIILLIPKIE